MSTRGTSRQHAHLCPADYVYPAGALAAADDGEADVLYVVGNLYGNTEALGALGRQLRTERGSVRVVFAGDFHWFDVADEEFAEIADRVIGFEAIAGNVERELVREHAMFGCGCAYPDWVDDGVAKRADAIIARLRDTAQRFPAHCAWLAALPSYRAIRVAGERVLLLHGDTCSLSGWRFAAVVLAKIPDEAGAAENRRVKARIIACCHTRLQVARHIALDCGDGSLINNGAHGMPNFRGQLHGVITRIAAAGDAVTAPKNSLANFELGPVRCDAIALHYDTDAWWRRFREQWPEDSPADRSYAERMCNGLQHQHLSDHKT